MEAGKVFPVLVSIKVVLDISVIELTVVQIGCFDEDVPFTSLSCKHAFWFVAPHSSILWTSVNLDLFLSNDCYREYLSIKIKEGKSESITCPAYKCTIIVPEKVVMELVDEVIPPSVGGRTI